MQAVATSYSDAWDTWSVGCIAYELLVSRSNLLACTTVTAPLQSTHQLDTIHLSLSRPRLQCGRSPFFRLTEAETRKHVYLGEMPAFPPRTSAEAQTFIRKALVSKRWWCEGACWVARGHRLSPCALAAAAALQSVVWFMSSRAAT